MSSKADLVSARARQTTGAALSDPNVLADREIQAHSRSMLGLTINKVPGQGHLVLTAGVEGLAKLWVRFRVLEPQRRDG